MTRVETLKKLKDLIPNENWFVSGSFANPNVENPNDIDIYFLSYGDFREAVYSFSYCAQWIFSRGSKNASEWTPQSGSPFALNVQLIRKVFGTPEEVFESFDLNLCKRAILPNGIRVVSPEATKNPYTLSNISAGTYSRLIKYLKRNNPRVDAFQVLKRVVDQNIEDYSLVEEYYEDTGYSTGMTLPSNIIMYKTFSEVKVISSYLLEQTKLRVPELLI